MPAKAGSLDYAVGDTVRHIKFDVGIVEKIEDGGRDYEVTVNFEKCGVKNVCCFCKIKEIIKRRIIQIFIVFSPKSDILIGERKVSCQEGRQEKDDAYEQTG